MALNRKTSKHSATIVPMVLADLPSLKLRTYTLQLKFAARLQTLPKRITTSNPVHQRFNKLRNSHNQPRDPVATSIKEKRDEEYISRRNEFKTINCLRTKHIIDPILYLPSFSKDRHRLIKWRMHWLPSYPLKDCRCGHQAAHRTHFTHCLLLEPLMQDLLAKFGTIPLLPHNIQPLDHILNCLPRSEVGLATV
ncbi:hypothetical protein INT45_011889 [Circinella minor]|uniref:Uncharacterized protein n=1 Tax=Circinella minor TaxID=1195481 RepID=A0A8H7RRX8_9FUNG|nr:hypothetical protein INT45_011889 [Circinella minor]